MLETSNERVKLLKAGISGKTIEKLYLKHNNIRIINTPVLFELVEISARKNHNCPICNEAFAGYCCL